MHILFIFCEWYYINYIDKLKCFGYIKKQMNQQTNKTSHQDAISRGIEQITSLEDLYKTVRIITIKGWSALIFIALFAIAAVIWSFLGTIPITVTGKCVAVYENNTSKITILGFIPLSSAEQIQPGMKTMVALDSFDSSVYGIIEGTVSEISAYPVDPHDERLQIIPSLPLKEYLTEGKLPTILITIDPISDPQTPTQIKWTSKEGPLTPINAGSVGTVQIILNTIKPISYVIPKI